MLAPTEAAGNASAVQNEATAEVPILEPALWRQLADAADLAAFATAWLPLQCRMLGGVRQAALIEVLPTGPDRLLASSPPSPGFLPERLAPILEIARGEGRGVAQPGALGRGVGGPELAQLAFPVQVGPRLAAIVAVELETDGELALRRAMRQLQRGVAALRERCREPARQTDTKADGGAGAALELIGAAIDAADGAAACRAVATELALRTGSERVSIGFLAPGHVRAAALSHSPGFGARLDLVRRIGTAMDEAIDQRAIVLHPAPADEPRATRAHAELAGAFGSGAVLTLPALVGDRFAGAILLERPAGTSFSAAKIALLDAVAAAVGPVLEARRLGDRWLIRLDADVASGHLRRLLGPRHLGRKLGLALAAGLVLAGYLAKAPYAVMAPARIEGLVQRAAVAAQDGYLREGPVRAGDQVQAGQLMAALDDGDLQLERLSHAAERRKRLLGYGPALGGRDRAAARIARSQVDQAEAQIRLIDEKLTRTRFVAPFDGLVVLGDPTRSIGGPVERCKVLFEVAPLDGYRVVLKIDQSQIGEIAVGRSGRLLLGALPDEPFAFTIAKLTPVAAAEAGRNSFKVEAALVTIPQQRRPGMEGVAKIDVDRRRWVLDLDALARAMGAARDVAVARVIGTRRDLEAGTGRALAPARVPAGRR